MSGKTYPKTRNLLFSSLVRKFTRPLIPKKCYRSYLRPILDKVQSGTPGLPDKISVSLAVKACNNTADPSSLISTLLVVGILPRFQINPKEYSQNMSRLNSILLATKETNRFIFQQRFGTTLSKYALSAKDNDFRVFNVVLIFHIKPARRRIVQLIVQSMNGKMLFHKSGDKTIMSSIHKVYVYKITAPNWKADDDRGQPLKNFEKCFQKRHA